jgi:hypothetical protein
MKFWFSIIKKLTEWGLIWIYNYIDSDDNGEISQEEIKAFSKKIKIILKGR